MVFEQFFQTCQGKNANESLACENTTVLCLGVQHSSRKPPWYNFKPQHHPPPSQSTRHSSHPKFIDRSLSANSNSTDKPLPANSNPLLPAASTATTLVNPSRSPPTKEPHKDPPPAGNENRFPAGNRDPPRTGNRDNLPAGNKDPPLAGNKDPPPDSDKKATPLEATQKNTDFNWTPGHMGGAWNRNRNASGYSIFGSVAEGNGTNRTGSKESASSDRAHGGTGVEKAPFLNMRGGGGSRVRPSPWRTGTGCAYPFTGSTYNYCFQGRPALSSGYAGGYSRHGALGWPGRGGGGGNSNLLKSNEIHLNKDKQ